MVTELEEAPEDADGLRMTEARAALAYFLAWQDVPISWKGTERKPIREDWHRCGMRHGLFQDGSNRHAVHPVNAMLNYAYASLESQVQIAVVSFGLDPILGYLHASRWGRFALVYDLMEPLRPQVDRRVLAFVRDRVFTPSDFVVTSAGVCRLHPRLARCVADLTVPNEKVRAVVEKAARQLSKSVGKSLKRPGSSRESGIVRRGRPSKHV